MIVTALVASGCKQIQVQSNSLTSPESADDSVLVFEPNHVDIGTVKEGDEAIAFLRVRNAGDSMNSIVSVETSCGCTVATPEQSVLMPGGFTRIKVVVDTFAKQGKAKKWVLLTDAVGRHSKAWLTLHVRPNPHLDVSTRSIFKGKCAACHFDPAMGKVKGVDIYQAVCAMCHGDGREGGSGPSLKYHHDEHALLTVIGKGAGSQHMPGFAINRGGPLTDRQVVALAEWLSMLDK